MRVLVCENKSRRAISASMMRECVGKLFTGINIARHCVCENPSRGTKYLDEATGCLEKLLWTNDWKKKKIVLKIAPSPQKSKQLPYMEKVVDSTKKGKVVQMKQVWIGQNHIKAATCYSERSFFKNRSQQQQLASSSYQRTQPLVKFLIKTWLRSEFRAQFCWKWINCPFAGSDVQLQ